MSNRATHRPGVRSRMPNPLARCVLPLSWILLIAGCAAQPATKTPPAATLATPAPSVHYLAPNAVDAAAIMPAPYATDSAIARGERELLKGLIADATPASLARAVSEDRMTPWLFAQVLGPGFSAEAKPKTAELLRKATEDSRRISDSVKDAFGRARPLAADPTIKTAIQTPASAAYPSGHATRAWLWCRLLCELAPADTHEAIRARARLIGVDRLVAGVHFPTDVAAGFALGNAVAEALLSDARFKADLDAARSEWREGGDR